MKLLNLLEKGLLEKSFLPGIVRIYFIIEHDDKAYAIKTISKLQIKKKPFLQKYIDQEI